MKTMTKDRVKQIALDLVDNKIFASWMLDKGQEHLLGNIFMPLMLMTQDQADDLKNRGIEYVYEYYDQAGPRSINGYPIFFSMKLLTKEETKAICDAAKKIFELKKNFMDNDETVEGAESDTRLKKPVQGNLF